MKCEVCHKEFDYPDFGPCTKQPGNHSVAPKTYVHGGSARIQNVRDRRRFSPLVELYCATEAISASGQITHKAGLAVQFADARYITSNPEEQWYLENYVAKRNPISWGAEGEALWRKNQLTPAQQNDLQKAELADVQRQIREANDLLAQVKAQSQKKATNAGV